MIISAVYSALRGGRMFALALVELVKEKGWSEHVEKLPGVAKPFDPETTYLDEVVGCASRRPNRRPLAVGGSFEQFVYRAVAAGIAL